MKVFYDVPYIKEIYKYVLVPVIIILLIVGLALYIYSKKNKDHEDAYYNFVMNFWSCFIGIIITGVILAIALAFSFAMTEKMQEYHLVEERKMLYYLLKYFVVIPIVFVIWYLVKLIKTIYHKPSKRKTLEKPEMKDEKPNEVIAEEKLPPLEESMQEELDKFNSEPKTTPDEEVEIISMEEEEENHE